MSTAGLSAAVVTGAGRGIGAAIARALWAIGHPVALLDIDEAAARAVAAELRDPARPVLAVGCDVGKPELVEAALARVAEALGPVGVLVNNAGVGGPFHRIDEVSDAEWSAIVDTNLRSVFLLCRALLPGMRVRSHGRIVNIASIQGFLGAARSSTYVATKHAVLGYTRALAAEWGAWGITVNAVCPGYIDTRQGVQPEAVPDHLTRVLAQTPAGRLGEPEAVAALVAWLVGPDAAFVNGTAIPVDGGLSAHVGVSG